MLQQGGGRRPHRRQYVVGGQASGTAQTQVQPALVGVLPAQHRGDDQLLAQLPDAQQVAGDGPDLHCDHRVLRCLARGVRMGGLHRIAADAPGDSVSVGLRLAVDQVVEHALGASDGETLDLATDQLAVLRREKCWLARAGELVEDVESRILEVVRPE